jgi:MFS family permease
MWVIVVSGALHNFNLYGISAFLPAYLSRYHHASVQTAGFLSGALIGIAGAVGLLAGGWLGDEGAKRANGRMILAGTAMLLSAPLGFLALQQTSAMRFVALLGAAYTLMYVYYAAVYATIHDIVEPALRGTAMALYFFAMYMLGASLGPLGTGWLSDFLARRAAGIGAAATIPEHFRAVGLHRAMHVVPVIAAVIAVVLLVGAVTVRKDMDRLRAWMSSPWNE